MFSKPYLEIGRRRWALFQICGVAGFALSLVTTQALIVREGLSRGVLAAITVAAVATFFGLVLATKILTGRERIIYYHHEIAVIAVTTLLVWLVRKPVLPYLDITILGIGIFLAGGRVGCLMAGCCHGRPHAWGVYYTEEHAVAGFPSYLLGVRLFPIQAAEALCVLCIVLVGVYFVLSGRPPGTAFSLYVVAYGLGRFFFEFARGDADRPFWLGFSQPQWLSLFLMGAAVWAELSGSLPLSRWHLAVLALLCAVVLLTGLRRRLPTTPAFQLLQPKHVRQIAHALKSHASVPSTAHASLIPIARTSLGILISGSELRSGTDRVFHYTISSDRERMTEPAARTLAKLIGCLKGLASTEQLIAGSHGVFHVVMTTPMVTES